jgi:hypothetical protein
LRTEYESYEYVLNSIRPTVRVSKIIGLAIFSLLSASAAVFAAPAPSAAIVIENKSTLGVIKGVVRDDGGSPISDATVAIFRGGTSQLLKQVSSGSDGSFIAKILPGTYTVLAVAQGFNPITLFGVEVGRASEVSYGFKLERAGAGNTLPEKKLDRSSSKWRIRAAQSQRSIYQNRAGNAPEVGNEVDEELATDEVPRKGRSQTVIETYFASSEVGNFSGVNFATLLPVGDDGDVVIAGQFASTKNAPQRIETAFKFQPAARHKVRFDSSFSRSANIGDKALGQFSVQATDEWKIRDGVILVLGFDYSQFTGAGNDNSVSPRIGLQYDLNSKTRFRTAFTTQTEERSWAHAIDLEDQSVGFTEPISVQDLYVIDGRRKMNKSRRLEFGIERILDSRSSVEANAFVDTTLGRGVGLNSFAFDTLDGAGFSDIVANQQGHSTGFRLVYTRRINNTLTANTGYAFGSGQRLSHKGLTNPDSMFEGDFFHSFFAELAASLKTGTNIRTVVRLSPEATVFAIDPFKGRLAIYDPGLSVLVTQSLPTLGLPIKAEAVVDARNIFDLESGVFGEEGGLRLNAQRRVFRGGIQVRF